MSYIGTDGRLHLSPTDDPNLVPDGSAFIVDDPYPNPLFYPEGETHVPTLVPGGAIERLCQAEGLTSTSDEAFILGDQIAIAATDKGIAVYVNGQQDAKLLPFA